MKEAAHSTHRLPDAWHRVVMPLCGDSNSALHQAAHAALQFQSCQPSFPSARSAGSQDLDGYAPRISQRLHSGLQTRAPVWGTRNIQTQKRSRRRWLCWRRISGETAAHAFRCAKQEAHLRGTSRHFRIQEGPRHFHSSLQKATGIGRGGSSSSHNGGRRNALFTRW